MKCPRCEREEAGDRCGVCGVAFSPGGARVLSVLAESGHGRVYRAEYEGKTVALKELVFALVPSAKEVESFEREAETLKKLNHPGVPRFVASFREGEGVHTRLYLAQEFMEG